jgi:hypothetical protein
MGPASTCSSRTTASCPKRESGNTTQHNPSRDGNGIAAIAGVIRETVREMRETMSLAQVADALGVTRSRVQQLEKEPVGKWPRCSAPPLVADV